VYRITFVIDSLRDAVHRGELNTEIVRILLGGLVQLDTNYLEAHPEVPLVRESGIRVEERVPGQEDWQDIPSILERGVAERRDLACWQAAEERAREKRVAFPVLRRWPTSSRITYCVNLFKRDQERELSHKALTVLLRTLMAIDVLILRANPTFPLLYQSGVRYEEEPVGQEDWQDAPTTLRMGFGDCEDLACWRAAELRVRYGIDAWPTFTYKVRNNGAYLYHITVRHPDGQSEDPSRQLGMR